MRQQPQDQRTKDVKVIERFERKIDAARMKSRVTDQLRDDRLDLWRSGNGSVGLRGKPQVDVIAVGIKILHSMSQSPKGRPCRTRIFFHQRENCQGTLLFHIAIRFFEGTSVEMIFVVADLPLQPVLM